MKALKTKFPCVVCGVPAEVRRLLEGPHALCALCKTRKSALSRVGIADWAAQREYKKVNGNEEEAVALLIGCLKSIEHRVTASRYSLEAIASAFPNDVVRLVRMGRSRAQWATSLLGQLEEFFEMALQEAKSARPLQVLDGGGETLESVDPPQLTILRKEEA